MSFGTQWLADLEKQEEDRCPLVRKIGDQMAIDIVSTEDVIDYKDISSEEYRTYIFKDQSEFTIARPKQLVIGKTGHRVVDSEGTTHWISQKDVRIIKWKSNPPISF